MSAYSKPAEDRDIPFSQELCRKATHMGALIIPGGYYFFGLSRTEMLTIMVPVTVVMLLIDVARLRQWKFWTGFACRIGGRMVRSHEEAGDFTGATYILVSVCCTVAMYEKMIAIAALCFIIVGDTLAALIGRRFGRHRFGRKSIEGSLGCLLGTLIVAFLVSSIPPWIGVAGAVTATVVEAVSFKIDDNISVPIVSGLVMTLLIRAFSG
jgi:dolichol kinase